MKGQGEGEGVRVHASIAAGGGACLCLGSAHSCPRWADASGASCLVRGRVRVGVGVRVVGVGVGVRVTTHYSLLTSTRLAPWPQSSNARMRSAASMPLMPGMLMSMRTRSYSAEKPSMMRTWWSRDRGRG